MRLEQKMKTLDEVIEAIGRCWSDNCFDCPYHEKKHVESCTRKRDTDALHYLKEYKEYTDTMCALPDYYEWVHSADNPPLSWEELKGMEGKPVWVEGLRKNLWGLVDGNYIDAFGAEMLTVKILHDLIHFDKREQGKSWQAYRKERE